MQSTPASTHGVLADRPLFLWWFLYQLV